MLLNRLHGASVAMPPQVQIQGVAVVLRGSFNPAIFHPAWFATNDLVRKQEAAKAKIELIHPEVASFTADWLEFHSTRDRLQVSTSQEAYFEPLRDLALSILDLLSHTPVAMMGLNRTFQYTVPSEQYGHSIGDRLAPKGNWGSILERPGMRRLSMEGRRTDHHTGFILVNVEPSVQVEYGIYIQVNDHYQLGELGEASSGDSAPKARDVLAAQWSTSMDRGAAIAEHIIALGEN
jgi:hypothetical protein